ncbi:MAG: hypothetical protein HKO57_14970, partial [Akkermansiaceae bacterium]|nr:hypothetical protein [Akkermansiaceae bacterium]
MSASPTAPAVDGFDIANYGTVTGTDKWWSENNTGAGSAKGQTFTNGPAAVELRAVSYQVTSTQQAQPTKTYVVRVGTVAGTDFTEIHSETFTQNFAWNGGEYMSWTFDNPPLLLGNTTYAVDIGMTSSTSAWQTGIPYINVTSNDYPGGQRYSSGQNGVGDSEMHPSTTSDRIFHLDLGVPSGSGIQFVAGNPADDSPEALIPPELLATFNQNLVPGTGDIIIRNLTDGGDTALPVGGPGISLSDNLLLIETAGLIDWNKSYAIRIEAGALEGESGDVFAGIADDTTWNFTTAAGDPLLLAIEDLKDHINGVITLTPTEIEERKGTIEAGKQRFDESAATIGAAFDLVSTYDAQFGPLFVSGSTVTSFNRGSVSDQDIHWVIYQVMQYIMDEIYSADTLADHEALLDGFTFGSSAHFPGSVAPPADPSNTHTATINGSFDETFGRDTQQWTLPARKPTGTYLAPGTIATVTVPPALVGAGYQVRVGAHSWDMSNRPPVKRLERATLLYALDAPTVKVASPYGGGIYIEVPIGADAGVVDVDITGAVRSPYFSAKSFHSTTASEWNSTERNHPAPWADFQTDKFMMQVSREWIYAMDGADAVQLMADWDAAMDAINDLIGFPRIRG